MKVSKLNLPIFDFNITMLQIESKNDVEFLPKYFKEIKLDKEHFDEEIEIVTKGCFNGGNTYRNFQLKRFLILIYPCKSQKKLLNIKAHELRHLTDRILEWANIEDIETAAFLQGYLFEKLY